MVVAGTDPNPLVSGQGLAYLRSRGITVEVGLLGAQAHELNIGFFSRMTRQRPWVRLKIAASLDGQTALGNGVSQWITSAEARADGHAWRARSCAVLTGMVPYMDLGKAADPLAYAPWRSLLPADCSPLPARPRCSRSAAAT